MWFQHHAVPLWSYKITVLKSRHPIPSMMLSWPPPTTIGINAKTRSAIYKARGSLNYISNPFKDFGSSFQGFIISDSLTPHDFDFQKNKVLGVNMRYQHYMLSIRLLEVSLHEVLCIESFHYLIPGDPNWPSASTKNSGDHLSNMGYPHVK